MKKTRWFLTFLKNVDFSTTKEIPKIFPQAKFVVISQEDLGNFILRKIAFVIGPYLLCKATNKTKKIELKVSGKIYYRFPIKTELFQKGDDYVLLIAKYVNQTVNAIMENA